MVARRSPTALPSTKEHRWQQTPTILSFVCIARISFMVDQDHYIISITIVNESL